MNALVRSAPIREAEVWRPTPEDLAAYRVPQWVKVVAAQRLIPVPRRRYNPIIEIAPDGERNRRRLLWFSFAPINDSRIVPDGRFHGAVGDAEI